MTCAYRYFTIDGRECAEPGTIEGVLYFDKEVNYHSPMQGTQPLLLNVHVTSINTVCCIMIWK